MAVDGELTAQARSWTASMASNDQLAHSPNMAKGISAQWTVLGENVGVHGIHDVRQLFDAFVASPSHYQNLVDPRFRYVGVGVTHSGNGKLWTTHRFMAVVQAPPPTTAPPTTAPPTTAPPPTAAPPTTAPPTTKVPVTAPPTTAAPPPTTKAPTAPVPTTSTSDTAPPPAPTPTSQPSDPPTEQPDMADRVQPDVSTIAEVLVDLLTAGI